MGILLPGGQGMAVVRNHTEAVGLNRFQLWAGGKGKPGGGWQSTLIVEAQLTRPICSPNTRSSWFSTHLSWGEGVRKSEISDEREC